MKIAVFQASAEHHGHEQRLATLVLQARAAAGFGAELLIVPELYLNGYDIGREAIHAGAETKDGPSAHRIAEIARAHRVAIVYGYAERDGSSVYNAAQLITADGARFNHRKTHLFGSFETATFTAGETVETLAHINGVNVALLICYEIEFPENARLAALAGADLIAVPTALMAPYRFVARSMLCTRAYENQLFIAYANYCGMESTLHYVGNSCIVSPDGAFLAQAGDTETLLDAGLDLQLRDEGCRLNPYLQDRRPPLYTHLGPKG